MGAGQSIAVSITTTNEVKQSKSKKHRKQTKDVKQEELFNTEIQSTLNMSHVEQLVEINAHIKDITNELFGKHDIQEHEDKQEQQNVITQIPPTSVRTPFEIEIDNVMNPIIDNFVLITSKFDKWIISIQFESYDKTVNINLDLELVTFKSQLLEIKERTIKARSSVTDYTTTETYTNTPTDTPTDTPNIGEIHHM